MIQRLIGIKSIYFIIDLHMVIQPKPKPLKQSIT